VSCALPAPDFRICAGYTKCQLYERTASPEEKPDASDSRLDAKAKKVSAFILFETQVRFHVLFHRRSFCGV
jgi:hypothetical protein